jgi:hypothetical protein
MVTKMDLKKGYDILYIKTGDKCKTGFSSRYRLEQFMVMRFGFTNAPARCQDMMNYFLMDLFDEGLVVYIDDVLIYLYTEETHDLLVKEVLKRLADNDLVILSEKCMWSRVTVEYLGYVITLDSMEMGEEKIEAIKE